MMAPFSGGLNSMFLSALSLFLLPGAVLPGHRVYFLHCFPLHKGVPPIVVLADGWYKWEECPKKEEQKLFH